MELAILDFINRYLTVDFLNPIFKIITYSGNNGLIFIIVSLLFLFNKKTRKFGICLLISLGIGALITNLFLKDYVARIRPYEFRDIVLLIKEPTDFSFPSGHTTAAFAFGFVFLKEKFTINNYKIYVYVMIYSSLMAFSRLYFYVHYPSDILFGIIIGYVASFVSIFLVNKAAEIKYRKEY